jgi:hypothetical protein
MEENPEHAMSSFFHALFTGPPNSSSSSTNNSPLEFHSLRHLSLRPQSPPEDFLELIGLVTRLLPLRGLHSFAYDGYRVSQMVSLDFCTFQ